jgi:hypothetical protein
MSTIMMKGSTVRKWTIMITQMIMLRSKGIDNEDKTMKRRRMINYDSFDDDSDDDYRR